MSNEGAERVKRFLYFRDGALLAAFDLEPNGMVPGTFDIRLGDITSDGWMFFENVTPGLPQLLHPDDPRLPPLRALIPPGTYLEGWLLSRAFGGSQ